MIPEISGISVEEKLLYVGTAMFRGELLAKNAAAIETWYMPELLIDASDAANTICEGTLSF